MGMEFHRLTYDVCDLAELAVIHCHHGVEDAPLYRFQAVLYIGNRAVLDDIGCVFKKILVKQGFQVLHLSQKTIFLTEVIFPGVLITGMPRSVA